MASMSRSSCPTIIATRWPTRPIDPKRRRSIRASIRSSRRSGWRSPTAAATITAASPPRRFRSATRRSPISARPSSPSPCSGATNGPMDMRTYPQNLPAGFFKTPWMGKDFGTFANPDFSSAYAERAEIYDLVRDRKVSGFVTVSGDRHSFWAGYAAPHLPPAGFNPVGLSFITGSISAPGMGEAVEFSKPSPVQPLYVRKPAGGAPEHTVNLTIKRGVRSALEYAASGDIAKARALTNPDVAPHLEFVDMAGHGYAVVSAGADAIDTEFVCIVRPIARATTPDGGPLRYRVSHQASLWEPGTRPKLKQRVIEGDAKLAV